LLLASCFSLLAFGFWLPLPDFAFIIPRLSFIIPDRSLLGMIALLVKECAARRAERVRFPVHFARRILLLP